METKICRICKKEKSINEFYKFKKNKDGYANQCKECHKKYSKKWCQNNKEHRKKYNKEWYQNNKESKKESNKKWCQNNKERRKKQAKKCNEKWRQNNKEHIKKRGKKYNQENKERRNEYLKNRRKNDTEFVLRCNLSNLICFALKSQNLSKNGSSCMKYVSFNVVELKEHLENQFDENMSWSNHGDYWQIDHIVPVSLYDYSNIEEIKKSWALKNLRPLERNENNSKNNKLIMHLIEEYNLYDVLPKNF